MGRGGSRGTLPSGMRIQVLGCAGGSAPSRQLTSFQIDEDFVVDAGAITTALELPQQRRVPAIVMTHSHMDHVWSLPLFLSNRFVTGINPCPIYGAAVTLDAIGSDLFNGRIWPDFTQVLHETRPMLDMRVIEQDTPFRINGYQLTPVELNHTVPCRGYLIEDGTKRFLIASDTGPTEALWALAAKTTDLSGLVLECSFPDKLGDLARVSGHLTPATLQAELRKFAHDCPVYVTHMKPGYETQIIEELMRVGDDRIHVLKSGQTIEV